MGSFTFWLIIAVIALIIDMVTSSFLFVWFTIGGIAAMVAKLFGFSFTVQLITFIAVSAVFMAVGYPLVKKTIKKNVPRLATQEESYIGRQITVDTEVVEKGMIKLDGIYWTVRNNGEPVKKGDRVEIVGIDGNKLVITKIGG